MLRAALPALIADSLDEREILEHALSASGPWLLKCASDDLRGDAGFMLAAASRDPETLHFASAALRGDPAFISQAFMRHEECLGFATDRDFVLEVVQGNFELMQHASLDFRNDREFVFEAMMVDARCYQHRGPRLAHDVGLRKLSQPSLRTRLKYTLRCLRCLQLLEPDAEQPRLVGYSAWGYASRV